MEVRQENYKRCCWECNNLQYQSGSEGESGYSELTPGYPGELPILKCLLDHFDVDFVNDTESQFRDKILMAEDCIDFKIRA